MEVSIPQSILEALMGGGVIATLTLGILEWLKSREWWVWKNGDILILFSVGIGVLIAVLFRVFGWLGGEVAFTEAIGFGFASGLGASVLRDVFANVFQSQQQVQIIEVRGDVNEVELATALKAVEGGEPVEAE